MMLVHVFVMMMVLVLIDVLPVVRVHCLKILQNTNRMASVEDCSTACMNASAHTLHTSISMRRRRPPTRRKNRCIM